MQPSCPYMLVSSLTHHTCPARHPSPPAGLHEQGRPQDASRHDGPRGGPGARPPAAARRRRLRRPRPLPQPAPAVAQPQPLARLPPPLAQPVRGVGGLLLATGCGPAGDPALLPHLQPRPLYPVLLHCSTSDPQPREPAPFLLLPASHRSREYRRRSRSRSADRRRRSPSRSRSPRRSPARSRCGFLHRWRLMASPACLCGRRCVGVLA